MLKKSILIAVVMSASISSVMASEFVFRTPLDGVKASDSSAQEPGVVHGVCQLAFRNLDNYPRWGSMLRDIEPISGNGAPFDFGALLSKSRTYSEFENAEALSKDTWVNSNSYYTSYAINGYEAGAGGRSYWLGEGASEYWINFKSPVSLKGVSYNDYVVDPYANNERASEPPYNIVLSDCSGNVLKTINITEQMYQTTINFADY